MTPEISAFTPAMIQAARKRISPWVRRTPLVYSAALSRRTGVEVYLKMECWQRYGCFKVRGVASFLSAAGEEALSRGLVTASSGNHGLALAGLAREWGRGPARVYVPETADKAKLKRLQSAQAEIHIGGSDFYAAFDRAQADVLKTDAAFVHSHADPLVIAGQGTIGLEILEDLPDADAIVVPIGGGGLISGIATAAAHISEKATVIGAEPMAAPGAWQSLKAGHPVERVDLKPSLADGLQGGLSPLPFSIVHPLVRQVALVSEKEILMAVQALFHEEQLIIEGAASVGLAALLGGNLELPGPKVVLVLTGRNVAGDRFLELMARDSETL